MRSLSIFLVLAIILTGCYSFNHIQLPEKNSGYKVVPEMFKGLVVEEKDKTENVPTTSTKPERSETKQENVEVACQPYVMPVLEKTPELPLKELKKINPRDAEALDQIQTQHIVELRAYIAKMKQDLRASHNDYLAKCYANSGVKPP